MKCGAWWLGCSLAWLVAVLPQAAAQSTGGAPAQDTQAAREHFRRGEVAYAQGDYELAIREWQSAYDKDPRPRLQFALSQAYERLGRLNEAVIALRSYLDEADPNDAVQADARARLAALESRLQRTGVIITGGVEGAAIFIDGQEWGRLPRPDRIGLTPGNHRILIRMEGYQDHVSNVVVPAGQVVQVPMELQKREPASAGPGLAASAPGSASRTRTAIPEAPAAEARSGLPWFIAAGVLAAGAAGSLVYFLDRDGVVGECERDEIHCGEQDAVETERTLGLVGTGVLGAGAIGALVVGLLVQGDGDAEHANAPGCGLSFTGVHCHARF